MRRNVFITVVLSAAFLLLGGFVFRSSYVRFWETLQDLRSVCGVLFRHAVRDRTFYYAYGDGVFLRNALGYPAPVRF